MENPADVATRGAEPASLAPNQLCWSGPKWLALPSESWPVINSLKPSMFQRRLIRSQSVVWLQQLPLPWSPRTTSDSRGFLNSCESPSGPADCSAAGEIFRLQPHPHLSQPSSYSRRSMFAHD
ncbi:hypothetical protein TSAR_003245 [Trichomalopsis sarcophagae]|uniref:Uncharacterized protein n=1 Tax=Trichomalopsis sarcophagae TaxID=543379 RepID=A0A232EQP3_9HYME|nr:hypothetical protein TSAR_003245 [Trichomalopsis sarcophagae]